jgi:hypothetical protein
MKALAAGLLAGFAVLLGVSVYIAESMNDGTVEENYYSKSLDYFRTGDPAGGSEGSFVAVAGGRKILLDIAPKPLKAMRELTFSVEVPGYGDAGNPWIDLGMAGMRMPLNRIDLRKEGDGRYRGKGVVVKCPSGMRTWTAAVNLPGEGKALITFDVAD